MRIFKAFVSRFKSAPAPHRDLEIAIVPGMLYLVCVERSHHAEKYLVWSAEEGYLDMKLTVDRGTPAELVREMYYSMNAPRVLSV